MQDQRVEDGKEGAIALILEKDQRTHTSGGAQASPPPKGIYVPLPTLLAKEGTSAHNAATPPLDLETQTAHSLFLVKGGIKGLVSLGSAGEAIFLRSEERKEWIVSQRKALDDERYKDRPIIAGTATQQIDATLQLVKESKEDGAVYAMVLRPGYFAPATRQEGIRKWVEAVAYRSASPTTFPSYPQHFEKLAAHPQIVGTKPSHGIIDDQTLIAANPRIDREHFYVFTRLGQELLPVLTNGGVAAIDGLAGVFPRIVARLFRIYNECAARGTTKNDIDEMRLLQYRICEAEKLVAAWGVVGIKEALGARLMIVTSRSILWPVRRPTIFVVLPAPFGIALEWPLW
ncbi:hypothetical protein LTR74_017834 [Friedmanniomyces endolithicus]|nr:hypothetical protein LTR74_017834 [Friedmanniomyces endolithicus]